MIKALLIFITYSVLTAQQNIEELIRDVNLGKTKESLSKINQLEKDFPNNPGVMYLSALLETDGDKARKQYESLYKNHPNSEYSDDAVMKIAEYYYAAGLYIQSSKWTKRMARYYARSEHIDRAVKLFLNALIISGSKDTAHYYSKVFKKQFPKMDVDTKLSELLNELEVPIKDSDLKAQVVEADTSSKSSGILDKIVETLSSPVPDDINLSLPSFDCSTNFYAKKEPFSLQVGAYSKQKNANQQKNQLNSAGFTSRVETKESKGRLLYVVKIGFYSDRVTAKAVRLELKSTLGIDTFIVENN